MSAIFLALPIINVFTTFLNKDSLYSSQLIGLEYNKKLNNIITLVQEHRALVSRYFHTKEDLSKKIIAKEVLTTNAFNNFLDYDAKNFKISKNNFLVYQTISEFNLLKFEYIKENKKLSNIIFTQHSTLIENLIKIIHYTGEKTNFSTGTNTDIGYISLLLENKLINLQEYSAQLAGEGSKIFALKHASKTDKTMVLHLHTQIKNYLDALTDRQRLINLDSYHDIQIHSDIAIIKLKNLINIAEKNIFLLDGTAVIPYDSALFYKKSSSAIANQIAIYNILYDEYKKILNAFQQENQLITLVLMLGFVAILVATTYVFFGFYFSITTSIRKLENASKKITAGNTQVHIDIQTKDEIGSALQAFNTMSETLHQDFSLLNSYKIAMDTASIISRTNPKGIITYVNDNFCKISGYKERELIGEHQNIVRHPDMPSSVFQDMWSTIKNKKIWQGIIKNKKKDGSHYIVNTTILPRLDTDGNIIEFIGIRNDITEIDDEINKQKRNHITQLRNRVGFLEDIKAFEKPIILNLDINNFSSLNNFYGSEVGDCILIFIGKILEEIAIKEHAKVYNIQADTYVLVFESENLMIKNYEEFFINIIEYIEKQSIKINQHEFINITATAGISTYKNSDNYDDLLQLASLATKNAKHNSLKILKYEKNMESGQNYVKNMEWITKIKDAIDNDRIVPFFQPIIDNKTGLINKYESLVRLIEKNGKVVSPFFFLDVAKKSHLYQDITKIVIEKSFAMFESKPHLEFSINLSIEDILNKNTVDFIFKKIHNYPHPEKIIFEITEDEEIKNYDAINNFIVNVQKYGVQIAIDDFGTGYSNFEHIIGLDAKFIKIDGSLVKNIDCDPNSRIIVEGIIAFSKKLGRKTIVEFVHKEDIYTITKEIGADYSQGYYLGEPKAELISSLQTLIEA